MATQEKLQDEESWQTILANSVTNPAELLSLLHLDKSLINKCRFAAQTFPLRIPRGFIAKIKKGDINDPLLKQILPINDELIPEPGYSYDPLVEKRANPVPGLLHKYKNRVLLTVVGNCAINCRYCFRRHFPYADNNPGTQGWHKACEYIAKNKHIDEVILSGGDPLLANDKLLSALTQLITNIPHVQTLRIHTRMPIVLPERINQSMIDWFCNNRLKPVLIVHCNHPRELDSNITNKMKLLQQQGVTLLNQSVLLKGVNDSAQVLIDLSNALFNAGIMPYYLHLLDKVQGAAHFDTPIEKANEIYKLMMEQLPGYLVPKLVKEEYNKPYKTPVHCTLT